MNKLLIGFAEESIVPHRPVILMGQLYERISDRVESEISVTAMAVQTNCDSMIMISADLPVVSEALICSAREKFASMTDEISPSKIIIGAIHTHTSIGYLSGSNISRDILNEFLPEGKKYTETVQESSDVFKGDEALDFIANAMATAAKKAWDSRKEAKYANSFGRAVVGHCRRVVYDDGSAKMWGDSNSANFLELESGNDSGIELMYFFDTDNKLEGVMANIACPAQVLEHHTFISSDYCGKVKKFLREKFGDDLYFLLFIGAAGDQCPRDMIRWVDPDEPVKDPHITRDFTIERKADPSMFDIKGCTLIGKRVANEIINVYEELEADDIKSEAVFEHKILNIDLPLRKATIEQYEHAVREIEYYVEKNRDKEVFDFKDKAAVYVHAGTIARYRLQQNTELLPIESHVVRFGDVAIVTNPFELFLNYGNYIKARSYAKQTFICELTCGWAGYLPTERAEKGSHYSAYITSGKVGHEGGDLLVRKTLESINNLFPLNN